MDNINRLETSLQCTWSMDKQHASFNCHNQVSKGNIHIISFETKNKYLNSVMELSACLPFDKHQSFDISKLRTKTGDRQLSCHNHLL